jgi:hypothetical protein
MKRSAVLAFGNWCLHRLVEFADINWTPYVMVTEYAFTSDKDKYYWVLKTEEDTFITVSCDKDFTHVSQGIVREGQHGKEFGHRFPKEVEKQLRYKVVETIKQKALSVVRESN